MYERKIPEDLECGVTITAKVLGGKWKPCIIDSIRRGIQRPSELHQDITEASPRVINMQLRELLDHGIIDKKIYPGLPLKVEYNLTPVGEGILFIIDAMDKWGEENRDHVLQVTEETAG
ncbi:winged helix-turn-helix transcriptional regulator [Sinomicrobium weinanense]|uniref:Helix-turn-helix transcriptional regulator n=1 Tax=Sinomicrobium weinanense TaxID=2842200 RepID=A0A926JRI2_9FLAO|nr:helix-turn-helix domain-containing protein [Sinomicrobium weinanense]MBC9795957.1 helix-turn-helix transcriptional regulator [Sinomicrobium weinanense]MBU3122076.1 helix-turn-helix transcriptional regulator [Sinomicrobium weinanense]